MERAQRAPETLQFSNSAMVFRVLGTPIRVLSKKPPAFDSQPKTFWERFTIIRNAPVSLEDILEGRQLPPLDLKTFEQYLCFEERSPENLYFALWLQDYEKLYKEWEANAATEDPTGTGRFPSVALIRSFNDAKEFFFRSRARLELNITRGSLEEITSAIFPPHPDQFRRIHDQVCDMLQESLRRFLPWARQNIGWMYTTTASIIGLFLVCVSFLPFVLGYIFDQSPLIRLAGLLPLLFGFFCLESARNCVCPFIFSMGDAQQMRPIVRQMRSFEITPTIPLSRQLSLARTLSRHSTVAEKDDTPHDIESHPSRYPPATTNGIPPPLQLTASFIHDYEESREGTSAPQTATAFEFEQLPNFFFRKSGSLKGKESALPNSASYTTSTASFPNAPCFTKLVPVHNPIVHRMQWEVIIRTAVLGVIVAGVITGGLIAVPRRH